MALTNCLVDSQVSITQGVIQVVNDMVKQEVTPDEIQFHNIHHELSLSNLFTNIDLYEDDSYASYTDWKIEKELDTDLKKLVFNIDVEDNKIADLNKEDIIHLKDGLPDDNNTDIKDSRVQHNQDDRYNRFCTLVENKLQPSHQLEGQNDAND